jgi:SAM-dependent methyltransferase
MEASKETSGIRPSCISELHCPYCGSALELVSRMPERSLSDREDKIQYGVLRCACYEYPIVEGIPIIQHLEGLSVIVTLIKKREGRRALLQALNVFRVKWAHRSRWHQFRYHLNCRRFVAREDLSFEDAVNLVRRPQVFSDYLLHRYANPSFMAAVGVLQLLGTLGARAAAEPARADDDRNATPARPPRRVLDLACGAGHSSFLMRQLFPALSVVSVDHDFVSLYLAKRFLAPDTTHLCLDAEVPSPFVDEYFDAIFCLDAFHYFQSKRAILAELKRVARPQALWLFPHLHNALQANITAGVPLSPEKYLECFSALDARLFDETEIIRGLSERHTLELERQLSIPELNKAQTLTLIGGTPELWRGHHGFPSALCKNRERLVINPIYRQSWQSNNLELNLTWPNDVMREECSGAEAFLPCQFRLSRGEWTQLFEKNPSLNMERLHELVAKFILVPLPSLYTNDRARNFRPIE